MHSLQAHLVAFNATFMLKSLDFDGGTWQGHSVSYPNLLYSYTQSGTCNAQYVLNFFKLLCMYKAICIYRMTDIHMKCNYVFHSCTSFVFIGEEVGHGKTGPYP